MRAICVVNRSFSSHPALSSGPETSEVATVESDAEDIMEVTMDDHTTGKKVAALDFDL